MRPTAAGIRVGIAVAALGLVVAGCSGSSGGQAAASSPPASPTSTPSPSATTVGGGTAAGSTLADVPSIVQRLQPSVVTIQTSSGLGSGVVYRADGIIVTDAHVVAGAKQVTIAFADGTQANGTVIASDSTTDVAVVQSDRKNLPPATFQNALPQVGSLAVVLGSPLGLQETVTAGIISGLNRSLPASEGSPPLIDLIQTDAPISPGNSGGPVVNGQSQVVGLAEAYIPPSAGAVALGFVTPSATVTNVADQLIANGHATHAYVGLLLTNLTPQISQQLGVNRSSGVVVLQVTQNGPASKAGVQPGDLVIAANGKNVATVEDFSGVLRQLKPGDHLPVTVLRQGKEVKVDITVSDRPQS